MKAIIEKTDFLTNNPQWDLSNYYKILETTGELGQTMKEGAAKEEYGCGFNKFYAEKKLKDGERIFFREFSGGKHKFKEVTWETLRNFPLNELENLCERYMTAEIVADTVSNSKMLKAEAK